MGRWTEGVVSENTCSSFPNAFPVISMLHRSAWLSPVSLNEILTLESCFCTGMFENTGALFSKLLSKCKVKWDFQVPSRHLRTQVGILVQKMYKCKCKPSSPRTYQPVSKKRGHSQVRAQCRWLRSLTWNIGRTQHFPPRKSPPTSSGRAKKVSH